MRCYLGVFVAMRFFDNGFSLETTTIKDFIRTLLNLLVLGPFRLVQEMSKKIVYLKSKSIEQVLFLSVFIGFGFTAIFAIVKWKRGTFNLFEGKVPLVVILAGAIVLIGVYILVTSVNNTIDLNAFSKPKHKDENTGDEEENSKSGSGEGAVYDDSDFLDDIEISDVVASNTLESVVGGAVKPTAGDKAVSENVSKLVEDALFGIVDDDKKDSAVEAIMGVLRQYDSYTAPINEEIYDSTEIRNYQNAVKAKVNSLQEYGEQCTLFSTEEVNLLQQKLEATTPPSKYLSKDLIEGFTLNQLQDEEVSVVSNVDDVPDDFTLCM